MSENLAVLQARRDQEVERLGEGRVEPEAGAAAGTWDHPQGGEPAARVELWVLMDRDLEARAQEGSRVQCAVRARCRGEGRRFQRGW